MQGGSSSSSGVTPPPLRLPWVPVPRGQEREEEKEGRESGRRRTEGSGRRQRGSGERKRKEKLPTERNVSTTSERRVSLGFGWATPERPSGPGWAHSALLSPPPRDSGRKSHTGASFFLGPRSARLGPTRRLPATHLDEISGFFRVKVDAQGRPPPGGPRWRCCPLQDAVGLGLGWGGLEIPPVPDADSIRHIA